MHLQPTGQQLQQLQAALLDAFDHAALTRLVRYELELDLEWITPVQGKRDLTAVVDALIAHCASQQDGLKRLVAAACQQNPTNERLAKLSTEWSALAFEPISHPQQNDITNAHIATTIATDGGLVNTGTIHASGHVVGRDLTINNYLTSGLANLPFNYSARIEEFLFEYLGSKRKRVPFGGRTAHLHELDTWLHDRNTPPYYLMTAEAGRGKSALICRWQTQVLTQSDVEVIFIPISIRFETATQDVVFALLAARLAVMHGETIRAAALSADQWRATCQSYLRRELPSGKQLLLILDGLDEAIGWQAGRGLFPGDPPDGLRVLVTARQRAGEWGSQGWAATLGWEDDSLATKRSLPGLDRFGVQEALASMGNPLDQLATQVDVVTELYRLSEGDPLLVRLYVDALVGRGQTVAYLSAEELATIQPGLQGYFDRWWDEQHQQWRSEGRDPLLEQEHLRTLLNSVSAALGPLTISDLMAVSELTDGMMVRRLAQTVSRWLIGDGKNQGYTFSHPRLGYYFWEQMVKAEQVQWDVHFTAWGARTVEALNHGKLTPQATPRYLVQHYASHLARSSAPAAQFYSLLSNGWRQAWEEVDVTNSGFLNDVAAVEAHAKAAFNAPRPYKAEAFVQQIKAALCRASIKALGKYITPELLRLALIHGLRTPTQALTIAQLMPKDGQCASTLIVLLPHLPGELLGEVLTVARAIEHEDSRVRVLGALAPYLSQEQQRGVLNEALAAARALEDERSRAYTLGALAPYLSQEQQRGVLDEALAAARAIEDEYSRALTLGALAPHLPQELLGEALTAARVVKDEFFRALTLGELAPYLSQEQQRGVLDEALAAARTIKSESFRASALGALAPYLSQEQQRGVLDEALAAAMAIEDEYSRARTLGELAPHLPQELLGEALTAARAIEDEYSRAETLGELAPHLPQELLGEALAVARAIKSESFRASALGELAPHLPQEQQRGVLGEALAVAIEDERSRAYTLGELAPHLPQELLGEALAAARAIEDEDSRAYTLGALAPYLSQEQQRELLGEALAAARAIESEPNRASALGTLAPQLTKWSKTASNRVHAILFDTLQLLSRHPRPEFLGDLVALLPVLLALVGDDAPEVAGGIFKALRDVSEWWP